MSGEEEVEKVENVLERGTEKLDDLKQTNQELVEANRRLVELVRKLELALEEEAGGTIEVDQKQYSFEDGWQPTDVVHDQNLDLGRDIDMDDIDRQVGEVIKSMKRIEDLN